LVAGSQGVITKRIDLALLEGQELFSRSIERAALAGAGAVLAAVAWFAQLYSRTFNSWTCANATLNRRVPTSVSTSGALLKSGLCHSTKYPSDAPSGRV